MHSKATVVFFNYGLHWYLSIFSFEILQNSWLNQENLYEVKEYEVLKNKEILGVKYKFWSLEVPKTICNWIPTYLDTFEKVFECQKREMPRQASWTNSVIETFDPEMSLDRVKISSHRCKIGHHLSMHSDSHLNHWIMPSLVNLY